MDTSTNNRTSPFAMNAAEFKAIGHQLIDQLAGLLDEIDRRPVTTRLSPGDLSDLIGRNPLSQIGQPAAAILEKATTVLFEHSLLNGHPKFAGYITSSPAPIGALADLLAAVVNPNVGAGILSPVATLIEKQAVKWLGELLGLPACFDGLLVSGGNMANFTGFCAGLHAKLPQIKEQGIAAVTSRPMIYCCRTTHTWIEKAVSLFGLGTGSISWIPADHNNRMNIAILAQTIQADRSKGRQPVMIVATAGDVSTGAVDDLLGIAAVSRQESCWFHIDGAYGLPAVVVEEYSQLFSGLTEADSIAVDPHKWLYAPLEAGCTLVKDPNHLIAAYSSHPVYYNFDSEDHQQETRNFYEYGFQNSRGFRALKVWMLLQQGGRQGYAASIATDIRLAALLFKLAMDHTELEAVSHNLSIATFRFNPPGYPKDKLNALNERLLNELQRGGELFLSNAVIDGAYCLRACIVNFRTTEKDIEEMIDIVIRIGRSLL